VGCLPAANYIKTIPYSIQLSLLHTPYTCVQCAPLGARRPAYGWGLPGTHRGPPYMRNRRTLAGSIRPGDQRASGDICQPVLPPSLRFCVRLRTICAPGCPLTANWGTSSHFQRSSVGAIDAHRWPLSWVCAKAILHPISSNKAIL
jgi:hypothetical protein